MERVPIHRPDLDTQSSRLSQFYAQFGPSDDEDEFWGFHCEELGLKPYRRVEASESKAAAGTSRFGRRLVLRRPEASVGWSAEQQKAREERERDDERKRGNEEKERGGGGGERRMVVCRKEEKKPKTSTKKIKTLTPLCSSSSSNTDKVTTSSASQRSNEQQQSVTNVKLCITKVATEHERVTQTRTGRTVKSPLWMKDHFPRPLSVSASKCLMVPTSLTSNSAHVVKVSQSSLVLGAVKRKFVKKREREKGCDVKGLSRTKYCGAGLVEEGTVEECSVKTSGSLDESMSPGVAKVKQASLSKHEKSVKVRRPSLIISKLSPEKQNNFSKYQQPSLLHPEVQTRPRLRASRCHRCKGCLRSTDCAKCINCLDKRRFGGPNVRRQCCVFRKCVNLVRDIPLKSAPRKPQSHKKKKIRTTALPYLSDSDDSGHFNSIISHPKRQPKETETSPNDYNVITHTCEDTINDLLPEREARPKRKAALNPRFRIFSYKSEGIDWKQDNDLISMREHDNSMNVRCESNVVNMNYGDDDQVLTGDMVIGQMVKSQKMEKVWKARRNVCFRNAGVKLLFKSRVSESEAWRHGYCVPMLESLLYTGPLCYLCGSAGVGELVYCMACNEPFHPYCCDYAPTDHGQWYCSNCIVCDICLTMDNLLECDQCHRHYHECCLSRDHPLGTDDDEVWKCSRCVKCVSCGSVKAGQYDGARWHDNFTLCEECSSLKEKGNVCPICGKCYQDFDFDSKMIQCALCEMWIHAACANVSDDEYNALSLLPDSVAEFECQVCCPVGIPRWKSAITDDLNNAMQKICLALQSQLNSDIPMEVKSLVDSIEMGQYSSAPTLFAHNVLLSLKPFTDGLENIELSRHLAAVSFKDSLCNYMSKLFPWFSLAGTLNFEPVTHAMKKNKNAMNDTLTATPYPSYDHSYSKTSVPNTSPMPNKPTALAGQRDVPCCDRRQCVLCLEIGDKKPTEAGRMVCVALDEWAHVNCCLWSAEVFERQDGRLQHLDKAIARGRQLKCDNCGKPGATIGCCDHRCRLSYHFMCARDAGCLLLNNKQVFCPTHISSTEQLAQERLHVDRRVYVDLTKSRPSRQKLETLSHQSLKLRIGTMLVTAFGKLVEGSDTAKTLLPAAFKSTRMFWSTLDVSRCCQYTCTVVIQGDTSVDNTEQEISDNSSTLTTSSLASSPINVTKASPSMPEFSDHNLSLTPSTMTNSPPKLSTNQTLGHSAPTILKARRELIAGSKARTLSVSSFGHKSKSDVSYDVASKPNVIAINMFPQNEGKNDPKTIPGVAVTQGGVSPRVVRVVVVPAWPGMYQMMSTQKHIAVGELIPISQPTYLPRLLPKPLTPSTTSSVTSGGTSGITSNSNSLVTSGGTSGTTSGITSGVSSSIGLSVASGVAPKVKGASLQAPRVSSSAISTGWVISHSSPCSVGVDLQLSKHMEAQQSEARKTIQMTQQKFLRHNLLQNSSISTASSSSLLSSASSVSSIAGFVSQPLAVLTLSSLPFQVTTVCTNQPITCLVPTTKEGAGTRETNACVGMADLTRTTQILKSPVMSDCLYDSKLSGKLADVTKTKKLHSICDLLALRSGVNCVPHESMTKIETIDTLKSTNQSPHAGHQLNATETSCAVSGDIATCCSSISSVIPNHMTASSGSTVEGQTASIGTLCNSSLVRENASPQSHHGVVPSSEAGDKIVTSQTGSTRVGVAATSTLLVYPMASNTSASASTRVAPQALADVEVSSPGTSLISVSQSGVLPDSRATTTQTITSSVGGLVGMVTPLSTSSVSLNSFGHHLFHSPRSLLHHPTVSLSASDKTTSSLTSSSSRSAGNTSRCVDHSNYCKRMSRNVGVVRSLVNDSSLPVVSDLLVRCPLVQALPHSPPLAPAGVPNILRHASSSERGFNKPSRQRGTTREVNDSQYDQQSSICDTQSASCSANVSPILTTRKDGAVRQKRKQNIDINYEDGYVGDVSCDLVNEGESSWSVIESWVSASPVKKRRMSSRRGGGKYLRDSEFDIPVPPAPQSQQESEEVESRSGWSSNKEKLIFVVTNDDGFRIEASSCQEAWAAVIEAVVEKRRDAGLCPISFAGIDGLLMFGLNQEFVVSVIEQLPNSHFCSEYNFKCFNPRPLQSFLPVETEVKENPHGAARAIGYERRSPHDMFSFLNSKHRVPPQIHDLWQDVNDVDIQSRHQSQSNQDLPIAMRYRAMQKSFKANVAVFRSAIHGRGLFSMRDIEAGEMVIEYSGTIIRSILTDRREKFYESKGIGCYMFRINDDEVIDATMSGNAARFINHSCEPNCFSRVIAIDNTKKIVIFASRNIMQGEEMTYDYKFPYEDVKIPCNCGARRCRKYLN
ncbi:uncharacterized protein LOC134176749 isoform X2 [Corticium candelabrum]|uniref:uncharacterized protein LOC134176749 isoform X2 n=1 Tax=Corticium candelabrum TaxID=121492 RepID=UPI002E267273|nr:uncharacterized protein LOC134176749 isoform X2 [Corticium candelabrum]